VHLFYSLNKRQAGKKIAINYIYLSIRAPPVEAEGFFAFIRLLAELIGGPGSLLINQTEFCLHNQFINPKP
jgi:hypothetical protein